MFCCLLADPSSSASSVVLERVARACSPRVAVRGEAVLFDATGCDRAIGPPATIAREVQRLAGSDGIVVRVALASTATAAWLLAHARSGVTIADRNRHRAALAPLSAKWLIALASLDADAPHDESVRETYRDHLKTFEQWGLRLMGDIASLPEADIRTRMGASGARLHQAARGEDVTPLVPEREVAPFLERLELEWPIDGLEPLAFVLARQCDRLSLALERADRGAVVLETTLTLVTRDTHVRTLHVPAPIRDARVLRTLILLDLESHPPSAAIDIVELRLDVTPGRILQGALLAPTLPAPEEVTTLLARLGALMGESHVGSPVQLDSWNARAVDMAPFQVTHSSSARREPINRKPPTDSAWRWPVLRRFRLPVAARVAVEHGRPIHVTTSARALTGGRVVDRAGPWRTSGHWWAADGSAWDRDEWDLALADGVIYRVVRHRQTRHWEIEGVLD